eukprot:TRINITY_DN11835_c0_g1_i1.p1 TRINITY_DN11835_c0_g1~~TRINITY_DN11835_c0_g1_i1.p1  ORF type:complete len:251 (-),score=51.37 TRINITY_DN11835_c0_g1_i1:23-730(-)
MGNLCDASGQASTANEVSVPQFEYVLTYLKGAKFRAHACRIALNASGLPWRDASVPMEELVEGIKSGRFKAGIPLLQVPSGKVYGQSLAISRFASKLGSSGLYPSDPMEALQVDIVMDACQDCAALVPKDPDPKILKEKREEYAKGKLAAMFEEINKIIEVSGGPFVLGSKPTIADLVLTYLVIDAIIAGDWDHIPKECLDQWPLLLQTRLAILESSLVKSYEASEQAKKGGFRA